MHTEQIADIRVVAGQAYNEEYGLWILKLEMRLKKHSI